MTTGWGPARFIQVYGAWVVLVTGAVIAAAVAVGMATPSEYRSEAIVVVEARIRANTTPIAPDMGTEKELARSGLIIDPAAQQLGTTASELMEGLEVGVAPDADVLTFGYTHGDPVTAQRRAAALAAAYVSYRNSGRASDRSAGRTGSATAAQQATLVTPAVVPDVPVAHPIWIEIAVGTGVGLLLGVGTALLRDRMSDRIRGRDDFQRVTGASVLATVPRDRRRRRGPDRNRPVLLRSPGSPAAESFRYLRSRLQPLLQGAAAVLVTSAGGREGRTTTAANLAVALAQSGREVVLVDADLRDPRLHLVFGTANPTGLTRVLSGRSTVAEALQHSPVPNLRLLTAGPVAPNAGDLLDADRLRHALDALRAHCDVVVIDSAPVLAVSDTIALATVADHVVLVGNYRRTTRRFVQRMLAELSEVVQGSVSAVLLNVPRGAGGLIPRGRAQLGEAVEVPPTTTLDGRLAETDRNDPSSIDAAFTNNGRPDAAFTNNGLTAAALTYNSRTDAASAHNGRAVVELGDADAKRPDSGYGRPMLPEPPGPDLGWVTVVPGQQPSASTEVRLRAPVPTMYGQPR